MPSASKDHHELSLKAHLQFKLLLWSHSICDIHCYFFLPNIPRSVAIAMSSDIGKKRKTFKRPNSNSDKDDDDNIHINSKPSKKRVLEESNPSQVDQISSDQERVSKKSKKTQSRLESEESNSYANDKTIYIEGLPYTGTEDDVRNFFSSIGHIASIRLPIWHDSARLRGYGHVEFTDSKYADKALGLDG